MQVFTDALIRLSEEGGRRKVDPEESEGEAALDQEEDDDEKRRADRYAAMQAAARFTSERKGFSDARIADELKDFPTNGPERLGNGGQS